MYLLPCRPSACQPARPLVQEGERGAAVARAWATSLCRLRPLDEGRNNARARMMARPGRRGFSEAVLQSPRLAAWASAATGSWAQRAGEARSLCRRRRGPHGREAVQTLIVAGRVKLKWLIVRFVVAWAPLSVLDDAGRADFRILSSPTWWRRAPGIVGGARENAGMSESSLATAQCLFAQALDAVRGVAEAGSAGERVSVLTLCEAVARQLDQVTVAAVAGLDREGVFSDRGYRSPVQALSDLLGWEGREARRRVSCGAGDAADRAGRGGAAGAVAGDRGGVRAGRAGLRHVEVIARVLGVEDGWAAVAGAVGRGRGAAGGEGRGTTPRASCRSGARRWWSCWTRTARHPTSGPRSR